MKKFKISEMKDDRLEKLTIRQHFQVLASLVSVLCFATTAFYSMANDRVKNHIKPCDALLAVLWQAYPFYKRLVENKEAALEDKQTILFWSALLTPLVTCFMEPEMRFSLLAAHLEFSRMFYLNEPLNIDKKLAESAVIIIGGTQSLVNVFALKALYNNYKSLFHDQDLFKKHSHTLVLTEKPHNTQRF